MTHESQPVFLKARGAQSDRQEFLPKALCALLANALPITLRLEGACVKLQQQLCFLSLLATDLPRHTERTPTSLHKAIYVVLLKCPTVLNGMVDGLCTSIGQPHELKKPRPNNPRPPGPTPPSPSPTNLPDNSSGDVSDPATTTTTSSTNNNVNAQHSHHEPSANTVPALTPSASYNHSTHSASDASLRSFRCFSTFKSGLKRLFFCIPSAERHR